MVSREQPFPRIPEPPAHSLVGILCQYSDVDLQLMPGVMHGLVNVVAEQIALMGWNWHGLGLSLAHWAKPCCCRVL